MSSAVKCWRCGQYGLPYIVTANQTGYLGTPAGHQQLLLPVSRQRYSYVCNYCGAPLEEDDQLRKLNGQMPAADATALGWAAFLVLFLGGCTILLMWLYS